MDYGIYLSLGANGSNAYESIVAATHCLAKQENIVLCTSSAIYRTEPQDYKDQPFFENCVVQVDVAADEDAFSFLRQLLRIEASLGRKRDPALPRFGPRAIDIDLLFFRDTCCETSFLTLPHPRMHKRAFVLYPLQEIAPNRTLYGKPLSWHLQKLDWRLEGRTLYQK